MEKEFAVEALALGFLGAAWVAATSPLRTQVVKYNVGPNKGITRYVEADFSMFSQCVRIEGLETACVASNATSIENRNEADGYLLAAFAASPNKLPLFTGTGDPNRILEADDKTYDLATPRWRSVVFSLLFILGVSLWVTGVTVRAQARNYIFLGRRMFAWLLFSGLVLLIFSVVWYNSLIESRHKVAKGLDEHREHIDSPKSGTGWTALLALIVIGVVATLAEVAI